MQLCINRKLPLAADSSARAHRRGAVFRPRGPALRPLAGSGQQGAVRGSCEVDLGLILRKRVTILGTVLRTRSTAEKALAATAFATHVLPLVVRGIVHPVIDRTFPAAEIRNAHRYLESNRSLGKVILDFSIWCRVHDQLTENVIGGCWPFCCRQQPTPFEDMRLGPTRFSPRGTPAFATP